MRKLALSVVVALAVLVPAAAQASVILEASLGRGYTVKPTVDNKAGPVNVEIAPGIGLGEILRAELGFVWDLPNNGAGSQLRLRPMLVFSPPIIPLYARLIVGMTDAFHSDRHFEFGGAVGVSASLFGVGLFGEVGYVPQRSNGTLYSILEGRVGGYYAF
jgi:hypothetical protein